MYLTSSVYLLKNKSLALPVLNVNIACGFLQILKCHVDFFSRTTKCHVAHEDAVDII